jgi:hypothetical protein
MRISHRLEDIVLCDQKLKLEYVTGNDSFTKFNPSYGIHGIIPAGFIVNTIKKIYNLKNKRY